MKMSYEDVLCRLKEERRRLAWTQKEMSQQIRMSQSHYSKVEIGTRHLTYDELKYMCETDIDMHYIFSGLRGSSEYLSFFLEHSYGELLCGLNILHSIILYYYTNKQTEEWDFLYRKVKFMQYAFTEDKPSTNFFYALRRFLGYRQQKMAEILEVDVKKLRSLETGKVLPNSEMLFKLYRLYNIPPSVIMKDERGLASAICCIFERMDGDVQKALCRFMRDMLLVDGKLRV